jgi:hypothetical protein
MYDYISRKAAIDAVNHALDRETILFSFVRKVAISALKKMPSADVAPVVRCENCIHWSDSNQCARPELSGSRWHDPKYFDTYPDDFCSYGERSKQE